MSFTFAYGLMSYQFAATTSLSKPDHIDATPAEKLIAVAARDLALERIIETLLPKFEIDKAPAEPSQEVNELLNVDFNVLKRMREEKNKWDTAALRVWTLAFHCEDTFYQMIGTNIMDEKNVINYRTGFAASFDRHLGTAHKEAELDDLDKAFNGYASTATMSDLRDWVVLSLKHCFQRPRPYQYALEMGDYAFEHKRSASAHSPALPSGHAYDAALAAVVAAANIGSSSPWWQYRDELPCWAAAFADRRNYAGLHFPSDNWASWIAAATIIEAFFTPGDAVARAKVRLRQNIRCSKCFQETASEGRFSGAKALLVQLIGSFD